MIKLYLKTFTEILRKTWILSLVTFVSLEIINIITELLFYDTSITFLYYKSYDDMPLKTSLFLNNLYGNSLMGLQGYVFGFAFFLLFFLIYMIFSSMLYKDFFKRDITLLKVRTFNFNCSNGLYFYLTSLNYLLIFIIGIICLIPINLIGNHILNLGFDYLRINIGTIITNFVLFGVTVLIFLFNYLRNFSDKKILKNIREIF